ncbi:MAG TPA: ParA family protein [Rhizomicrobium sp.]|jgi:chromosome partitioning protein|nr:ParA family protein [Rhizomicrobium sp.]
MYVIVCASQKGGSGKTTLSGHLAVEACRAGAGAIALIDTDPQGSLAAWWNARNAPTPHFVKAGIADLEEALTGLHQAGVKIAIIDTPPAITQSISKVVSHADLVVVPTRPSPHDLRAVGATVDIAERHGKPVIFVINAATPRARITGESAVALSQHGTVAPVTIHHRVDFAASMIDGRTVGEVVPNSQSAKEMKDLWVYIQERLSRIVRDPDLLPELKPDNLAVSSLMPENEAVETPAVDVEPPVAAEPPVVVEAPDRRPRVLVESRAHERRAFGRRGNDHPLWGVK